jgi:tetratricopeptide (TPR) repeat protein
LLSRLLTEDPAARQEAIAAIETADARLLPAIAVRLETLKRSADRAATAALLAQTRARGLAFKERRAGAEARPADLLDRLLAVSHVADDTWRNVVSTLFLSRLLAHIATTPAVRELVGIYDGFGETLRTDIEQQIKVVGERAIPALIELKRGESREIRILAAKLLEFIGKAVPGEAVQTADNTLLAEILRAYGRTKDADAARVIVAFANSHRAEVRQAAREAAFTMGETGLFALRESYEGLIGKKPPSDWSWDKVAKELFAAYDRARLSELYAMLDEGLADFAAGKLESMAATFDRILARDPSFERRQDMVPGWIAYAKSLRESDGPRAMAVLRRVLRLAPEGERAREAEAELRYLEAVEWEGHGVIDESGYRRALELDPSNADARVALDRLTTRHAATSRKALRYGLGAGLTTAVVLTVLALLRRRRVAAR